MTAFLPLDTAKSLPSSPAFLVPSPDPTGHVKHVIKAILKARRVAVVCGAGISVKAGIPDFRSSEGVFQSVKKNRSGLTSGKELFDVSVFTSEDTTSLFCQTIARLSQLSEAAEPTAFHQFLRILDDRHRLLRVYTQNIDGIEEKSGLTFGVAGFDSKGVQPPSRKGKPPPDADSVERPSANTGLSDEPPARQPLSSLVVSPMVGTPRCIPLHGTLRLMHCIACAQSYPLCDYVDSLVSGTLPPCPQCVALEEARRLIGKRSHGVGKLCPSIVLYNEEHRNGEEVGDVVRKDLTARADLLLVAGTSLRVPGTKRIVRQFSKAVRSLHVTMAPSHLSADDSEQTIDATISAHRRSGIDEERPVGTIYVNLDFPVSRREWEGVFDVWVQGDAQEFARMIREELEKEEQVNNAAKERKRKREEDGL